MLPGPLFWGFLSAFPSTGVVRQTQALTAWFLIVASVTLQAQVETKVGGSCRAVTPMAKDSNMQAFMMDFLLGGVSGAVAKTLTAPIERVKLVVQTQDANPKIRSGEVPRYTGIVDCAQRILKEQGLSRFWDGNFTNCLRYFPTQAFNLAFKDTFKKMFPKYNPKTESWQIGTHLFEPDQV